MISKAIKTRLGPLLLWLCCLLFSPLVIQAQDLVNGEYFFDQDPGLGLGTPFAFTSGLTQQLEVTAPASGLEPGYHIVSYRFQTDEGVWGITASSYFYVNGPATELEPNLLDLPVSKAEYFWNSDPGPGNGIPFFIPTGYDTEITFSPNALTEAGDQLLGVRCRDLNGTWGQSVWTEVRITGDEDANAPIASFTFAPQPVFAGDQLALTSTSQNLSPNVLQQWDVDGDNLPDYTGAQVFHSYSNEGIYPVRLSVINRPSALARTADVRYYFRNGNLNDAGGTFDNLSNTGGATAIEGRQADMIGARQTGPGLLQADGNGTETDAISFSFWFKGDNSASSGISGIQLDDSTGFGFTAFQSSANHNLGGSIVSAGPVSEVYNSKWNHIALTYGNGLITSYLNGEEVDTENLGGSPTFSLDTLTIGGLNSSSFATGAFDDLLVYTRALTAAEVETLANETYVSTRIENVQVGLVQNLQPTLVGDTVFCEGELSILFAPEADSYLWNTGETTQSIEISESGTYSCLIEVDGSLFTTNTFTLEVVPVPDVALTTNDANNGGNNGSAGIEINVGSSFVFDIDWSTGATLPSVEGLSPGSYDVTVDDGICPVTIDFDINDITDTPAGVVAAEYFIGSDPGPGNGTQFSLSQGDEAGAFLDVDLTGIPQGIYPVSVRVRDEDGSWGITRSTEVSINTTVEEPFIDPAEVLVAAEYFFDEDDPGAGNATALASFGGDLSVSLSDNIEVGDLATGPHKLTVRFQDAEGTWGHGVTTNFFIEFQIPPTLPDVTINIVEAEYFIGEDPGIGNGISIPVSASTAIDVPATIDVSSLPIGEYVISTRTRDVSGQWGITTSQNFLIEDVPCQVPVPDFSVSAGNSGEQIFFTNTSTNAIPGATVAWDINVDGSVEFTSVNAGAVFPAPGIYNVALTIDNGDPCIATTIKQVEVGPILSQSLSASGSVAFCEGGSVTLSAPAGSNYLWNTLETSSSISVGSSGVYECAYTDAQGNEVVSESIEVTVFPTMDIEVVSNPSSNGQNTGSAGVFVTGGNAFVYDFLWSTGSTDPIIAGVLSGNYQVDITDGVCPETIDITIDDNSVSTDERIAVGEYFWGATDPGIGNGQPLLVPQDVSISTFANIPTAGLDPGYYFLTVRTKKASGEWGIATTTNVVLNDPNAINDVVDQDPIPMIAAEYFIGEDPGPGNGVEMPSFAPTNNLSLSDLVQTIAFDLEPGPVRLSVRTKNEEGNWSMVESQNFFIQVTPLDNLSDLVFPIVRAEYFIGDSDPGTGNATSVAVPTGEMVAFPVAINLAGVPQGFNRVTVRVQDVNGNWGIASTTTFEVVPVTCPVPNVSFTASNVTSQISTLTSTSTNVLPGATYAWDFDADGVADAQNASADFFVPAVGTYPVSLTIDNGDGCVSSAVQELPFGTIPSNLITANGSLLFCEGGSVTLTAPAGGNYIWSDGSTDASLVVSESGSYEVSYTDNTGSSRVSEPINVTVYPTLEIETVINPETNNLSNGSAGVLVSGGSSFIYDYSWSNGETTPIITNLDAGSYNVQISDPNCPETVEVVIPSQSVSEGITRYEYFWDEADPGAGNGLNIPVSQGVTAQAFVDIPTAGLTPGYHFLSVRAKQGTDGWGMVETIPVYLDDGAVDPPAPPAPDIVEVEYFFDNDPGTMQGTPLSASISPVTGGSYDLATTGLGPGGHTISVRAKDADGEWGITSSAAFSTCNPPPAPEVLITEFFLCEGDDLSFNAEDDGFNLEWVSPQGTVIPGASVNLVDVTLTDGGEYLVSAESEPGCFGPSTIVVVNVLQPPVIDALVSGPSVICNTQEAAELFIPPIEFATNYNWQLPVGASIISGNNTNNISIDFSNLAGSQALVVLAASNLCGSDTASAFLVNFECGVICNVDGGVLSASGNLNPCVGDGEPSAIQLSVTGNVGNSRFGIIKTNGDVVASNGTGLFNMDNYPPGIYRFAHLSSGPGFSFAGVTNASQLSGCFNTSNLITFSTYQPDGGTISLVGSNIICGGTGTPTILPFTLEGSVGPNQRWAVLNQTFTQSLALSVNPNFNWDNFPPGIYQVVHAAYGDQVNLGQVDPQNIQGCIDASNVITVSVQSCGGLVALSTYPNPTDGISNVSFELSEEQTALLEVYDLSGRLVQTLFNSVASAEAKYRFTFDGSALPNGVYLYRLTTDSEVVIEKFMIAH